MDCTNIGALSFFNREFARKRHAVPVSENGQNLVVFTSLTDFSALRDDLSFLWGRPVEIIHMPDDEIELKIAMYFDEALTAESGQSEQENLTTFQHQNAISFNESRPGGASASTVDFVDAMISRAVNQRASDIHVEVYEKSFRVRFRIDGVLQEVEHFRAQVRQRQAIISRLKIMADLDIAEKRRPQDGRIRVEQGDRRIDIRVSTLPSSFGEKVVLRVLDKSQLRLDFANIGISGGLLSIYKEAISASHGIVLVTGLTGSGKTTTLYATLNHLNSPEINILTIEDPVEYNLDGINQSQVKPEIDYTFANALRAFLRQDPDVIMVGEIRDEETAEIAVRAALTGHLVFSTLHTNDAVSTLTRLLDMGVEPYLIASSVRMIVAQRLLRRLCRRCKQEVDLTDSQSPQEILVSDDESRDFTDLAALGIKASELNGEAQIYKNAGCEQCSQTGYSGRRAVYEMLPITPQMTELIANHVGEEALRSQPKKQGMRTLREAATALFLSGETAFSEVLRTTN